MYITIIWEHSQAQILRVTSYRIEKFVMPVDFKISVMFSLKIDITR